MNERTFAATVVVAPTESRKTNGVVVVTPLTSVTQLAGGEPGGPCPRGTVVVGAHVRGALEVAARQAVGDAPEMEGARRPGAVSIGVVKVMIGVPVVAIVSIGDDVVPE